MIMRIAESLLTLDTSLTRHATVNPLWIGAEINPPLAQKLRIHTLVMS